MADKAFRSGNFHQAIEWQQRVLKECGGDESAVLDSLKRLALYQYSAGNYVKSLETLTDTQNRYPDDLEIAENRGVMLRLTGQLSEAVNCLESVYRRDPTRFNVCDALAHSYAAMGNTERAVFYGRVSLELKDRSACAGAPVWKLPSETVPAFSFDDPAKNVLSFSLWGDHPRYLKGALRNAMAAVDLYPGWTCRFYVDDTVPSRLIAQLESLGAQIVRKARPRAFFDGLLWRFEVVSDTSVSHFLIRDCDSVVNVKERVAVGEWLESGKWFHAMRDFYSHTELLLAGMWGGMTGVFPALNKIRATFKPITAPTRTYDQVFLRECFWPTVKQSVLVHDSVFTGVLGSVPFPAGGKLPPRFHIGQNEAAVRPDAPVPAIEPVSGGSGILVLSGLDEVAVGFVGDMLGSTPEVVFSAEWSMCDVREQAASLADTVVQILSDENGDPRAVARGVTEEALKILAGEAEKSGVRQVVIAERDISVEGLRSLIALNGVRILGVIRDPRDTASDRRLTTVEDCRGLTGKWKEHVQAISRIHRENPGRVEIVRYEDLSPLRVRKTGKRLHEFLSENFDVDKMRTPGAIDVGKPLPLELKRAVEGEIADLLGRLRYPLANESNPDDPSQNV